MLYNVPPKKLSDIDNNYLQMNELIAIHIDCLCIMIKMCLLTCIQVYFKYVIHTSFMTTSHEIKFNFCLENDLQNYMKPT